MHILFQCLQVNRKQNAVKFCKSIRVFKSNRIKSSINKFQLLNRVFAWRLMSPAAAETAAASH